MRKRIKYDIIFIIRGNEKIISSGGIIMKKVLTVVAIMIIVFVALLIATMAGELVNFISVVAKEIVLNYF